LVLSAIVECFVDESREWDAIEGEAFGITVPWLPIKFNAGGEPALQNGATHTLIGCCKITTIGEDTALGEGLPIASLDGECVSPDPSQQDVVGRRIVGMIFDALPLKALCHYGVTIHVGRRRYSYGEAKYGDAPLSFPKRADLPINALPCFAKTARRSLNGRRGME
jgi:hypothetical protein